MILAHPARFESRTVRMHGEPFTGGSVTIRSEYLTAKPKPCSRFSSILFPCQKNVYRRSFSDPFSTSCVSCKVAMSMFSLSSSESIMDVFLESLIVEDHSISRVLTFQLAMRRSGIVFAFFCLPGGSLSIRLLSRPCKLHIPVEAGGPWRIGTLLTGGCPA